MKSKFMAASGCLVAALALGVTACGSDDNELQRQQRRAAAAARQDADDLLVAAAAGRVARPDRGARQRREARARAGRRQGRQLHDQVRLARRLDGPGRQLDAGGGVGERPQGRAGQVDRRLPRRVQLGRLGGLDPDPQRGRRPADLPGQHGRRPDHQRAGRRRRASRTSTTRRATRTYARIVPKDTIQGAALATLMKQDGCTKVAMTNDKEVYGAGLAEQHRARRQGAGPDDHLQRGDRQERAELPLAGPEGQGAPGADCFVFSGITANNAVQQLQGLRAPRSARTRSSTARTASPSPASSTRRRAASPPSLDPHVKVTVATLPPGPVPAVGPGVLQGVHAEVRRGQPGPVRDLRLRGHEPRAGRDQALRDRRRRPTSSRRCSPPRTARACSARTRSTRTATRR